ncbi:MAG: hypothetical protein CL678_12670 [Bdellovibrionaceae bacterium]|nr:hypothetical protein [Pseudobdellovibrionaceae bacterium]|tara:strand:- start:4322 stop:5113 length:792 start_codon:yes stop_codon:yes gene_type:complete
MKTLTEISGFRLQDAALIRNEIMKEFSAKEKEVVTSTESEKKDETPDLSAEAVQSENTENSTANPPVETPPVETISATGESETENSTETTEENSETTPAIEATEHAPSTEEKKETKTSQEANESQKKQKKNPRGKKQKPQRPPYIAPTGEALEKLKESLTEKLQVEGEKLTHLINALNAIKTKTRDLKRVVVYTSEEGEKLPPKAVKEGEHVYMAEYLPPLHKPKPKKKFSGKGKFGKNKKRNKNKRRPPRKKPAAEGKMASA